MKQLVLEIAVIILLGIVLHQFFPWWVITCAGGIAGLLFKRNPWPSFATGFLAAALLWGTYAIWIDRANGGLLSAKMSELFNQSSGWVLIAMTVILGGILGGLGTLTGNLGRKAFWEK